MTAQLDMIKAMVTALESGADLEGVAAAAHAVADRESKIHAAWLEVCLAATRLGAALADFDDAVAAYGKAKRDEP